MNIGKLLKKDIAKSQLDEKYNPSTGTVITISLGPSQILITGYWEGFASFHLIYYHEILI